MSILNKSISYFPSKNDTHGGVTVNLLQILNSTKHEVIIRILRAERDETIQKQIKEKLPCFTVAGVFTRRCESGLILPSGLAAVDLDSAEDYDVTLLLNELKKIPYIAYIGLSCRGKRLFAIVPLLYPDKYARHYDRLIKSFEDVGLPMGDTCHKAISQPRFVSYNTSETSYFNHDAKQYNLLHPEKTHHYIEPVKLNSNSGFQGVPENPFKWCDTQFQKSNAFIEGQRHSYIVSLARYCNIKGLSETDTLNGCIAAYDTEGFDELEISRIVKHIYLSHSSAHNTLPFKSSNQQVNENTGEARLNIADRDTLTPTLPVKQSYCLPPRLNSYGNYYFGLDGLLYNHRPGLPDLV
jgi:hypothetical protein